MNIDYRPGLKLAVVLTIALSGAAATAAAQQVQPTPARLPTRSATQFYPGTESTATYRLEHGTLTVRAGMPARNPDYGSPPAFEILDSNHDGRISDTEAQAYPPLDSDFLYVSGGAKTISPPQYERWVANER